MEDLSRIVGLLQAKLPPFITEEWRFWSLWHISNCWTMKIVAPGLSCEVELKDSEVADA